MIRYLKSHCSSFDSVTVSRWPLFWEFQPFLIISNSLNLKLRSDYTFSCKSVSISLLSFSPIAPEELFAPTLLMLFSPISLIMTIFNLRLQSSITISSFNVSSNFWLMTSTHQTSSRVMLNALLNFILQLYNRVKYSFIMSHLYSIIKNSDDNSIMINPRDVPMATLIWLHGRGDTPDKYIDLFTSLHSPVHVGFRVKILAAP